MKQSLYTKLSYVTSRAVIQWGEKAQAIKACEEMGELTTQLCKRLNNSPTTDEAVIDEIADVLIMAFQMRSIFGLEAVDERIDYKLERLLTALIRFKDVPPTGESMQAVRQKEVSKCV